jgi:hypothetical protein
MAWTARNNSATVATPLRSMSYFVRICTTAGVSASTRLMLDPVTSIFSGLAGAGVVWALTPSWVNSPTEPSATHMMRNVLFLMGFLYGTSDYGKRFGTNAGDNEAKIEIAALGFARAARGFSTMQTV